VSFRKFITKEKVSTPPSDIHKSKLAETTIANARFDKK
jgi:hypothetical protein